MSGRAQAPVPGDVIAGKFRVERVLGAGGMGVVVAATHLALGQSVALKFMIEGSYDPHAGARFLREARAASRLRSEHIARVLDVGELEGGAPYIVMELLEGLDLTDLLARDGPQPPPIAVSYILQVLDGLAEAHGLGIVHRDLKPRNLFLTLRHDGTPCVKILDFGLAKMDGGQALDGVLTTTQMVFGSPIYMSPEQLRSAHDADARSDLWAIGIILHELLAGKPPYEGASLADLCASVLTLPPPPTRSPWPIPPRLQAVIHGCLSKDPAGRPADAAVLAEALAPFAASPEEGETAARRVRRVLDGGARPITPPGGIPISSLRTHSHAAVAPTMAVGEVTAPQILAAASQAAAPTGRRTRRALMAAFVTLVAAGTAVGVVVAGGGRDAERAPAGGPTAPSPGEPRPAAHTIAAVDAAPLTVRPLGLVDAAPAAPTAGRPDAAPGRRPPKRPPRDPRDRPSGPSGGTGPNPYDFER